MGSVERKERAIIITDLKCGKLARKILQTSLRLSRPRTTCHDIVVECTGHGERPDRLRVRAVCTSPETKAEFIAMAEGYAASVAKMVE